MFVDSKWSSVEAVGSYRQGTLARGDGFADGRWRTRKDSESVNGEPDWIVEAVAKLSMFEVRRGGGGSGMMNEAGEWENVEA